MATPGAIAVYTSGSGIPEHVGGRPWKGVYHHWDGGPDGLGNHLLARVREAKGDVRAVSRFLVDDAPWGWSSCFTAKPQIATERSLMRTFVQLLTGRKEAAPADERLTRDDPGLPVSPEATGNVAFVYVFDLDARRLDAFATHASANGERIGSVHFSPTGEPDVPALDLMPLERVEEPAVPGPRLTPEALETFLRSLAPVAAERVTLSWVNCTETPAGDLVVLFRTLSSDEQGALQDVVEREWPLVPTSARAEPDRVFACLRALVDLLRAQPHLLNAFWIAGLDPLRRSGARREENFRAMLAALGERDLGAPPG